jgi:hypothetical protein
VDGGQHPLGIGLLRTGRRSTGEGCELRIFDPEVQLSRLLGANRNYIDANIPHLGSSIRPAALNDALQARLKPAHHHRLCFAPTTKESAGKRRDVRFLRA